MLLSKPRVAIMQCVLRGRSYHQTSARQAKASLRRFPASELDPPFGRGEVAHSDLSTKTKRSVMFLMFEVILSSHAVHYEKCYSCERCRSCFVEIKSKAHKNAACTIFQLGKLNAGSFVVGATNMPKIATKALTRPC